MSDTPINPKPEQLTNTPPQEAESTKSTENHSLLDDILKASQAKEGIQSGSSEKVPVPDTGITLKKKREPISLGVFMKLIGSILLVSVIFFGSFLAYIAFNPSQAVFFTRTFGIDPADVQNLLKRLINGTFGFTIIIFSIAWILSMFRAFWVPKELKRKRLLSWLSASLIGFFLFGILGFWAYLFRIVGATTYDNPNGEILIYDQDLYLSEKYRSNSRIYSSTNLIGPIDIFFDIRGNAEALAKSNLYTIERFDFNSDGAECTNRSSLVSGSRPETEQSIICTFSTPKTYEVSGTYSVRTREGEEITIPMTLPTVEVRGVVDIKIQENTRRQKIITLDATNLSRLGSPRWIFSDEKEVSENIVTQTLTTAPQAICLKIFESEGCDRIFILEDTSSKKVEGSINAIQDENDRMNFRFSLSGVTVNPQEIIDIEWLADGQRIICRIGLEVCNYRFSLYGRKAIKATLTLANQEKYVFETEVNINEPINIERNLKVINTKGEILNLPNTYDQGLRAFVLKNVLVPPEKLVFDARDIVSGNPGFNLGSVRWKVSNGKKTEEFRGERVEIDFNQPLRYTIDAFYTFLKTIPGENNQEEIIKETIIIDIERKNIMPRMDISLTSDYVPALLTVDASQSQSENGEIKKFIFDFGEGRTPAEGDPIQQYSYTTPGDKEITLTVITENGEKASLKKTIVLKDQIRSVDFMPSIQPATAGNPVDFEPIGTTGQVEKYVWNFGDNTPVSREYLATHTFAKPGKYTVTLTAIYTDGTQQSRSKEVEVIQYQE